MVLCPAKTSGPVVNLIDLNEDEVEDHFKTICLFSRVPSVKLRGGGVGGGSLPYWTNTDPTPRLSLVVGPSLIKLPNKPKGVIVSDFYVDFAPKGHLKTTR